jgi:16S rRNA (cytosine1402-N4)-methyltransferase
MHEPVLLQEAVTGLAIQSDGLYIDGTLGGGGHAFVILQQLSERGRLLAIDKDLEACERGKKLFNKDSRIQIYHSSFADIKKLTKTVNIYGKTSGILLDLGVSSTQLAQADRGFSFLVDGPLDMRMDTTRGITAAEWLNKVDLKTLIQVIQTYGEERHARLIAKAIVSARHFEPIQRTQQLVDVVMQVKSRYEKNKHPATRTFQAIRIVINKELEDLSSCLEQCLDVLAPKGRLVVISFHSLEDRIVKQFIKKWSQGVVIDPRYGIPIQTLPKRLMAIGKRIKPSSEECIRNPRARSAILRIAEKII